MNTSLNTNIPPEFVKKSKKLQEIIFKEKLRSDKKYVGLSLADVIDNAEMLFGKGEMHECPFCKGFVHFTKGEYISSKILERCQDDERIEEISQYIIDNIKEVQSEKE